MKREKRRAVLRPERLRETKNQKGGDRKFRPQLMEPGEKQLSRRGDAGFKGLRSKTRMQSLSRSPGERTASGTMKALPEKFWPREVLEGERVEKGICHLIGRSLPWWEYKRKENKPGFKRQTARKGVIRPHQSQTRHGENSRMGVANDFPGSYGKHTHQLGTYSWTVRLSLPCGEREGTMKVSSLGDRKGGVTRLTIKGL